MVGLELYRRVFRPVAPGPAHGVGSIFSFFYSAGLYFPPHSFLGGRILSFQIPCVPEGFMQYFTELRRWLNLVVGEAAATKILFFGA